MALMETELITPEKPPKPNSHHLSPFACFLSAAGATLATLCLFGSAVLMAVWAFAKLFGFPDMVVYGLMAVSFLPVIWATIWVAGRAWHIERRLSSGLDIDTPVFKLAHYFSKAR
jgi:hypothetical protein